jgi:uncharacterized protein YerC
LPRPIERKLRENDRVKELYQALLACSPDEAVLERFLRDLWTREECVRFANRFAVAKRLLADYAQAEVARQLRISPKTVGRIAKWVDEDADGTGGFREVVQRLQQQPPDEREDGKE